MSTRNFTLHGKQYKVTFYRGQAKIVDQETQKKVYVDYTDLTGRTDATLERGQWKATSDGMVTPRHIARYLLRRGNQL